MNLGASEPALIGVDWGTSSLRAFLVDAEGDVIDGVSASEGIMHVQGRSFGAVLDRLIGVWMTEKTLPILASGMITSRNGWVETPYAKMPLGACRLGDQLHAYTSESGALVHFVTGAVAEDGGRPDVMRGEETQIIGAAATGMRDGTFVMPGTHCKWVQVADGKIVDFSTYMTGEVFSALKGHTILGTLMVDADFDEDVFVMGVRAGREAPSELLHNLFHVRTLPLTDKLSKKATAHYLSGLLIGTEIASALVEAGDVEMVTVIGNSALTDRYEIALQISGVATRRASEDIVAKGHFMIARAAGLIG
ncbi:2-dehydro-3-deoxygalactonokinase [Dinoroseobacter sp. S124A]|uniref:2-dehydro-3-deoxygalactonokinase n=1 Tax=Dinoroseobacter sp. S124A TaxID=3415128 RepID=UPI003C7B9EE9